MSPVVAADTPEQAGFVAELARRYLWWEPVGDNPHAFARMVAQIMNLGTYEDIRRLEAKIDEGTLVAVMAQAQAGWFSERSWEFWRGRLSADTLPAVPPRRTFVDVAPV